jgi:hypothetical protein
MSRNIITCFASQKSTSEGSPKLNLEWPQTSLMVPWLLHLNASGKILFLKAIWLQLSI